MALADWLQVFSLLVVAAALVLNVNQNRHIARQTGEMVSQTRAAARSAELSAHQTIGSSNVDFSYFFHQDPAALRWLLTSKGYPASNDPSVNVRILYAIRRFDEHESIFLSWHNGLISDQIWEPWSRVLERDLGIPEFEQVLPKVRQYYATPFVELLDEFVARRADEGRTKG
jgi:hypothetical protein